MSRQRVRVRVCLSARGGVDRSTPGFFSSPVCACLCGSLHARVFDCGFVCACARARVRVRVCALIVCLSACLPVYVCVYLSVENEHRCLPVCLRVCCVCVRACCVCVCVCECVCVSECVCMCCECVCVCVCCECAVVFTIINTYLMKYSSGTTSCLIPSGLPYVPRHISGSREDQLISA